MGAARRVARRLSVGVVVIRPGEQGTRYLLLRAYNYWDFPKGEVEPGERPLQSAIREVAEETTLTGLLFRWGHDYTETPPYAQNKIARYYLAEAPTGQVELPVNPDLGRPEHHEYRWVSRRQARGLLNQRLCAVLDWAADKLDRP
jgi:bis(5'-nucleosidyl)-tetraphosphatase